MQIIQILLFIVFVTIYPVLLGCAFAPRERQGAYSIVSRWCLGWCSLYALLYWPAIFCIFTRKSLTTLILIWGALLLLLTVFALVRLKKESISLIKEAKEYLFGLTFPEIASSLAVLAHGAVTVFLMHIDDDDYNYVANATTSLDTNSLLKINGGTGKTLSSFSVEGFNRLASAPHFSFYAAVSKLFGTRPAALCHTYLPPIFTCLCFAALFLIGYELFSRDRRKTGLFAAFAFLISISSYYSVYTAGTFMLVRSWQGKAQVAGFIIPMVLWLFITILKRKHMDVWDLLILLALLEAACLLTAMGAVLCAGEALLLALLAAFLVKEKRIIPMTLVALLPPLATAAIYLKLS